MKKELLENGFITFDIDNELLQKIYEESINNNSFDLLKVSNDSIESDAYFDKKSFEQQKLAKNLFIKNKNLAQIWHWKRDESDTLIKLIYQIFNEYYNYNFNEINILSSVTLFTKDCFIKEHNDSSDKNRIAGILIYLNKNYEENNGGCLILKGNTKIIPEYGKVVIIDYTQNIVQHEVTTVIEIGRAHV